jgi:thiamine biosynthesis lipoprotein
MTRLTAALCLAMAQLQAQERFEFKEMHMGMEVRIVLYSSDEARARTAARKGFDKIEELENIMSDYRPESELRRLERRAGEWVQVSSELYAVLLVARSIAELTDGAFDPTVAPLVELWREARRNRTLPDKRALDSARALVGWQRLEVSDGARRGSANTHDHLVKLAPGTRLDLGGIAKGYIVQWATRVLGGFDVIALVEAGGDIGATDAPPGERGWRIASGDSTIFLTRGAVSTSGPQSQYVEIEGVRYSHVIDPRTGMALTNGYTATVVYWAATSADALATALSVLGPDGLAIVRRHFPDATAIVRRVDAREPR